MYHVHQDYIRAGVTADKALLSILSRSECSAVRRRVAENCNTPSEILCMLAHDPDAEVRIEVALNASTPEIIIKQLLCDRDVDVRFALAEAGSLSESFLRLLAADENCYVAQRAAKSLDRNNRVIKFLQTVIEREIILAG